VFKLIYLCEYGYYKPIHLLSPVAAGVSHAPVAPHNGEPI